MTVRKYVAYTDGACRGNPGPGGWGALLRNDLGERELSGSDPATTNNRMELMGAIAVLEALAPGAEVELHTDSQYVQLGITEWISNWKRRGWKTSDKKPVKNEDLWKRLDLALARHTVEWRWVKGHAGDVMNERADELARNAIATLR